MAQRRAKLFEMPEDILFSLKDIIYTPEAPRLDEAFTVSGKVDLFKIPFVGPLWIIATVKAPEEWWEHFIPIWGSPEKRESTVALGSDFSISFPKGFDRQGEYSLSVRVYPGPTLPLDSVTVPPFPAAATYETSFFVAGELPPEEANFRSFRITGYSSDGGIPVEPPDVLTLQFGDRCRVHVAYEHRESAVTGDFHAAIWQDSPLDPHDEVLNAEKAFSVPYTPIWDAFDDYIDIPITSAIKGGLYGLYVKIMGITGGDIFTEYLPAVIQIAGAPGQADIRDFDFKLQQGTYEIGATVPFTAPYEYLGIEQEGKLTIEIGTGVWPTFTTVYTYDQVPVHFDAAANWSARGLKGHVTLPDVLDVGQTYSTRATLRTTTIVTQEIDTDWGVLTIREEEIIVAFSLSKPSAYPYSAPPGPVLITCPVTLLSSQSVTAQVRCIVYEGSIYPGHGTKLWDDTKTITISPNETQNVQFMRTSVVGTIDRRDVEVEVRVAGQLIEEDEWDDIYYVTQIPTTVTFSVRPWGITPDVSNPKSWTCYYWDPGINGFVGDGNWHNLPDTRQFKNARPGGYLAAFYLDYDGTVSQQYISEVFNPLDGKTYQFELATGRVYQV